jgi:hypothetical protein
MIHLKRRVCRLSDDDWSRLTEDLADSMAEPSWPEPLTRSLARAIRFRTLKPHWADTAQRARILRRALTAVDETSLQGVLLMLHVHARADLQDRVQACLGLAEDAEDEEEGDAERPTVDEAVANVLDLTRNVPPRDVALCLAALLPCWMHEHEGIHALAEALEAALQLDGAAAAAATERADDVADVAELPREVEDIADPGLKHAPSFTNMDAVLIRATVDSVSHVMGSLDTDRLDDLVGELLEMNASRHQSWFHRGFLDALRERDLEPSEPGENKHRRAWRLAGYFLGLLRRRSTADVLDVIGALSPADRAAMLDGTGTEAGAMLAPSLIRPLLEAGRIDEALAWMRGFLVAVAPEVVPAILEWAREELIKGEASCVRLVLAALGERCGPSRRPTRASRCGWGCNSRALLSNASYESVRRASRKVLDEEGWSTK